MSEMRKNDQGAEAPVEQERAGDDQLSDLVTVIDPDDPSDPLNGWCRFGKAESFRGAEYCRNAAMALLQVFAFLLPAYIAVIAIRPELTATRWAFAPMLFWTAAIVMLVFVVLPWNWTIAYGHPSSIRDEYLRVVEGKLKLVRFSMIALAGGVVTAAIPFGI